MKNVKPQEEVLDMLKIDIFSARTVSETGSFRFVRACGTTSLQDILYEQLVSQYFKALLVIKCTIYRCFIWPKLFLKL